MKDPAFLFYPNDWIGGTMGMTFEEKGAYIELLMMQFNRGHMTSHMIGQTVGQLWVNIQSKFEIDADGMYFNRRLEDEQRKRKAFTASRRNNIKGENQHTKKTAHTNGHMSSHMENENISLNNNKKVLSILENYSAHLKKQSVTDRLGMNLRISPGEIVTVIQEFLESCYGEIVQKPNVLAVETYFMNWVKSKPTRVIDAINEQTKKNEYAKNHG